MLRDLDSARYFSLTTYRKDGRGVDTPVWFAGAAGTYYLFSAGDAGKVKRLRRSPRAKVAVCDVRGKVLGTWIPAEAQLLGDAREIALALTALRRKYGMQMRVADMLAKLSGRFGKRAYIKVQTHEQPADSRR